MQLKMPSHTDMPHGLFHTFNPLRLPGLVGVELEDFVDLGVESWLLGVPLTDRRHKGDRGH